VREPLYSLARSLALCVCSGAPESSALCAGRERTEREEGWANGGTVQ
jgi:hypothetical protein